MEVIEVKYVTDEMIFPIYGIILVFNNAPFYIKKIVTPISGESRNSIPPAIWWRSRVYLL